MLNATPFLRRYAEYRAFRRGLKSPADTQTATLLSLVQKASATDFGKAHGFDAIDTVARFQEQVPIRTYDDFLAEYFAPHFPVLNNVTWPGQIPYFAVSSGTSTGRTKHIPVSRQMLRSNARAGTGVLADHVTHYPKSDVLGGKSFLLGGSVAMDDLGEGVKSGDLSGIARLNNPRWSTPFVFPSIQEALASDWDKKMDRLAALSLNEPIKVIAGTPSWLLLFFERLSRVAGGERDIAALYPGLELMVYGGMSFRPYQQAFHRWFGSRTVDWREVYSASEGFVASADRGVDEGLRLNLDLGLFFEFVPLEELGSPAPRRFWVGNAPPGEYALILSTCAGLWAYSIGDVVELLEGSPPRIIVTGRTSYYLSAFGEHLSGAELEAAVLHAAAAIGAEVAEFAVTPLYPQPSRPEGQHLFAVELDQLPDDAARTLFCARLDDALAAGNEDYEVHRRGSVQLLAPDVVMLPKGAFARWMESRGKLGGQNKVPRVLTEGPVRDSFLAFVEAARG
ncbi:MAG: GH3 auxin-responsive promoter family protein [Pseudomonadota bacterium]